ncbi:hypothetical protein [Sphingomonas sp. R86520]|uniref:hypothetical protein n=1 Tax=Sphingomonas sp. R86520 TaxID=3093859 RepID=UPI0036D2E909
MNQMTATDRPRAIAEQLEAMIAFADEREDFVLGAMLADAEARLIAYHIDPPQDLPSARE